MRRVNFSGDLPNGQEENIIKNYHEETRLDNLKDFFVAFGYDMEFNEPVEEYKSGEDTFLICGQEKISPEKLQETAELVKDAVSVFYSLISVELSRAGVHFSEEGRRASLIGEKDILNRLILNFAFKTSRMGHYDHREHRASINYYDFVDNGKFAIKSFLAALVHELVHFVSYSEIGLEQNKKLTAGATLSVKERGVSGLKRFEGEKRKSDNIFFRLLNEGVVDLYAGELLGKVYQGMGLKKDMKDCDYSYVEEKQGYPDEKRIVKKIIEYLSLYTGSTYQSVWDSIKREELSGGDLLSPELKKVFEGCFGPGFVEDFLKDLNENNQNFKFSSQEEIKNYKRNSLANLFHSLERRWEEYGKKSGDSQV